MFLWFSAHIDVAFKLLRTLLLSSISLRPTHLGKLMTRVLRHCLILLVLLIAPAARSAPEACPAVTRVGVSDLGLTSYREDGRIVGLGIEVVTEAARRAGCKIEVLWFPRQRLFVELEAGRIDMTIGALRLPERDAYATHIPYAFLQYDLVLRRRDDRRFASLADFVQNSGGRLNLTRGVKYDPAIELQLDLLHAAGRLELVNDFETVFSKVEMGRADGTLATPPIYTKYMRQERFRNQLVVIQLPEASPRLTGFYISRRTTTAAARANYIAAVKTMVADQSIQTLYGRYFDEAAMKRIFHPGPGPLTNALNAVEP
jgi:polar amino acid transport system substrate-binding protein